MLQYKQCCLDARHGCLAIGCPKLSDTTLNSRMRGYRFTWKTRTHTRKGKKKLYFWRSHLFSLELIYWRGTKKNSMMWVWITIQVRENFHFVRLFFVLFFTYESFLEIVSNFLPSFATMTSYFLFFYHLILGLRYRCWCLGVWYGKNLQNKAFLVTVWKWKNICVASLYSGSFGQWFCIVGFFQLLTFSYVLYCILLHFIVASSFADNKLRH